VARPRRSGDLQRFFTFGDRVPPSVGFILVLMLAGSILGWSDPGVQQLATLSPAAIAGGQVWRLVTWPFVQDHPFTLIFGAMMIYWIGQQLAFVWSDRRFLLRFVGYAAFASVATTLLAMAWPAANASHIGIWPVANALLVSWAMLFPDRQVNLWGIVPLTGKTLAWLVVGGTFLYGLAGGGVRGIGVFSPHLFAIAFAWLLARGKVRGPWRDAKQWWGERDQKRRARHLKVVKKDGSDDRPRWMN
jgi:membrane associated rhomboid family serine protease